MSEKMSHKKVKILIIAAAALCAVLTAVIYKKAIEVKYHYNFSMYIPDTGKSDCIVAVIEDRVIMIDTADENDYDMIDGYLRDMGINKIDLLIITHFDKDHVGSAAKIVENYRPGIIYAPDYVHDSKQYDEFLRSVSDTGVRLVRLTKDVRADIGIKDVSIDIYTPKLAEYEDRNNYSLITSIEYHDKRFLFMGDAMKIRCGEFYEDNAQKLKKYDFCKLPHHGDTNRYLELLLNKIRPDFGVVTVKERDDTEKDDTEKDLDKLLGTVGTKLYYNCDGNIHVSISGGRVRINQES